MLALKFWSLVANHTTLSETHTHGHTQRHTLPVSLQYEISKGTENQPSLGEFWHQNLFRIKQTWNLLQLSSPQNINQPSAIKIEATGLSRVWILNRSNVFNTLKQVQSISVYAPENNRTQTIGNLQRHESCPATGHMRPPQLHLIFQQTITKPGNQQSRQPLQILWNKWYLHEISNDPSNTLGRTETTSPIFDLSSFSLRLSITLWVYCWLLDRAGVLTSIFHLANHSSLVRLLM